MIIKKLMKNLAEAGFDVWTLERSKLVRGWKFTLGIGSFRWDVIEEGDVFLLDSVDPDAPQLLYNPASGGLTILGEVPEEIKQSWMYVVKTYIRLWESQNEIPHPLGSRALELGLYSPLQRKLDEAAAREAEKLRLQQEKEAARAQAELELQIYADEEEALLLNQTYGTGKPSGFDWKGLAFWPAAFVVGMSLSYLLL